MVISYSSTDKIQIKTKNETVEVGSELRIGSYAIKGAGEYDVSGIHCETHALPQALASFMHTEDLTVAVLSTIDPEVVKLDDASNTDILIVELRSDHRPEELKPILKALEPAYLFILGTGLDPAFAQSIGLQQHDSSTLKVTRTGLPMEGTVLVPAS